MKKENVIWIIGIIILLVFLFIISGRNEFSASKKICKDQCLETNLTEFCCKPKWIEIEDDEERYTCQDKELETNCKLDCTGVCQSFCSDIKSMIPCAKAGCSWIVKDYTKFEEKGYCEEYG